MPVFSVIPDLCKQDGICASVCPAGVIKGPKGSTPFMRPGTEDNCIACGHCMAFCPHGAARVDALPLEDMRPLDRSLVPSVEALDMLCMTRRSTRRFTDEALPKECIDELLRAARHAPTAKNRRSVRWIVIHSPKGKRAVGDSVAQWLESCLDNPAIPEAGALVKAWRAGFDPLFRGAPHLALAVAEADSIWAARDAAIALTYLELLAVPRKIGACWAGYITTAAQHHKPLQELLKLEEQQMVRGGQMLGRIALRPTASAPRAPLPVSWL